MYKHRSPSLAELIANCWDAGAKNVRVEIPAPKEYAPKTSLIRIVDDGQGMDQKMIESKYLVVGRNRRAEDGAINLGRKVMGRKGIGKLAGFGLADKVTVTTWTKGQKNAIEFVMPLHQLKGDPGKPHEIRFPWEEVAKESEWPESGTIIKLTELRHTTPIDEQGLKETLSRRFSRTTRGEMNIFVNKELLKEPVIETNFIEPEEGDYKEVELPCKNKIKVRIGFSKKPISSKEMQGFAIYANDRTAQAPPFFFNVESTASAQHSTRYVFGEILADYLDSGIDDETDLISTDRQELDWEKDALRTLKTWGEEMVRKALRECAEKRGNQIRNWILSEPEFIRRISILDRTVKNQIERFLQILGQKAEEGDTRTRDLADSLIRAYEFRTFHDVVDDIEKVGEDPEQLEEVLGRLHDWKVLESRAILEIVKGRLSIICKLERMIVEDAPETASGKTYDNLHDLLAEHPWIFNPEWQVFTEEKTIGKQLKEWGERDCPEDMREKRVDFLAFGRETDQLVIIEMKRPGHAVELAELQRLEQYQVALMKSRENCMRVLVYGNTVNIPEKKWMEMTGADDFEALPWSKLFKRAKSFYSHYEAILSGNVTDDGFHRKVVEVARTREIIETGSSHRGPEDRKRGIGDTQP